MDFIVSLLLTTHKFDSIWVFVYRLTKSAHFIPVNNKYRVEKYVELYIARELCLHGVLKMIIFYRGSQFSYNNSTGDSQFSLSPADGLPN
jgi:hypothetical protein